MGKEIRPKREELEFVFDLFLRGYADADVLAKYLELDNDGKLAFPLRTDRRLISTIRQEFEAARTVLEPYLRRQIDPASQKAREEHLDAVRTEIESLRNILKVENIHPCPSGSRFRSSSSVSSSASTLPADSASA